MDQVEQIRNLVARGYSPQQAAALVSSGAAGGGGSDVNPVDAAIKATAARAGMDEASWRAIAHIESGLKPGSNANNPATSFKGMFQLGTRGPNSVWATHGSGDVYNPMDNARAAAELAAQNNAAFQQHFGRAPTPAETYLMHQQGLGFYTKGAMTNIAGNLPAKDRIPENMTHGGFENYWTRRIEGLANMPPGSLTSGDRIQVAGGGGGGSSGGGYSPAAAIAPGATAQDGTATPSATPDTSTGDGMSAAKGFADVASQIAKADQSNAPPPLPPLQMAQPMMTPAMLRARQLAQAMLARPVDPLAALTPPTGGQTS